MRTCFSTRPHTETDRHRQQTHTHTQSHKETHTQRQTGETESHTHTQTDTNWRRLRSKPLIPLCHFHSKIKFNTSFKKKKLKMLSLFQFLASKSLSFFYLLKDLFWKAENILEYSILTCLTWNTTQSVWSPSISTTYSQIVSTSPSTWSPESAGMDNAWGAWCHSQSACRLKGGCSTFPLFHKYYKHLGILNIVMT